MTDKITIKWQGPGWYAGRFSSDSKIIVEKVAETNQAGKTMEARAAGQAVNWYSEPPPYMEVIE